ncbi:MAG: FMN-binding protein [Victivallales bacterium]|nr:FMN-binding protein [Victivallales bacterium]
MKEIIKLTLSLTLICAIAGAALAFVNAKTTPRIEASKAAQRTEKMRSILPQEPASTPEAGTFDGVVFYKALAQEGAPAFAYCAEGVDGSGFGGDVRVLVSMDPAGKILGVLVSEHTETPGIGTLVCNRDVKVSLWEKLGLTKPADAEPVKLAPNRYLDSFTGRQADVQFAFDGDNAVTPISGATVSSRAVLNAVNRITAAWNANKATITGEAK